jgi:hypothetical protein
VGARVGAPSRTNRTLRSGALPSSW